MKINDNKISENIVEPFGFVQIIKTCLLQLWQKFKQCLIGLLLIINCGIPMSVQAEEDFGTFDWMTAPLSGLASLFSRLLSKLDKIWYKAEFT